MMQENEAELPSEQSEMRRWFKDEIEKRSILPNVSSASLKTVQNFKQQTFPWWNEVLTSKNFNDENF